ncbi:molybdenum cofactor guanylyltransferase [Devosia albogilva]|uniref:Molybdenum cofactor guanylyltransferase n=1 Tax=Devosia albogilva TaxID=429726 RepID=A0ABW5QQ09_9HYPH
MPGKDLHVLILAGGAGARLGGVRKSDLRVGGRPLLRRVVDALGPLENPLLVSTGPGTPPPDLPPHAIPVPDHDQEHAGPIAGLAAAVSALERRGIRSGLLLSVAVDTPFLPADYSTRLVTALGSAPAAAAAWKDQLYPTNALWRLDNLAAALPRSASPKGLLSTLGAVTVNWDGPCDPFANLNTLADLITLQNRSREQGRALLHS